MPQLQTWLRLHPHQHLLINIMVLYHLKQVYLSFSYFKKAIKLCALKPSFAISKCIIIMCAYIFTCLYYCFFTDCKLTRTGWEYVGSRQVTMSGTSCQRWDSQTPRKHVYKHSTDFPDSSISDAANFCRNPNKDPEGPWCYTITGTVIWERCDIPACGNNLLLFSTFILLNLFFERMASWNIRNPIACLTNCVIHPFLQY